MMAASLAGMAQMLDAGLQRLAGKGFVYFVLAVYSLSLLAKIVIGVLLLQAAQVVGQPVPLYLGDNHRSLLHLFVFSVCLAPWLETLLHQSLPLWLASCFTSRPLWPVLFSASVFGLLHYHRFLAAVVNAAVVGVFLAAAYWYRARHSRVGALLAVTAVHALHNGLAWLVTAAQRNGFVVIS